MRKLKVVPEPGVGGLLRALARAVKAASAVTLLFTFLTLARAKRGSLSAQLQPQPRGVAVASASGAKDEPYDYGITQQQEPLDPRYAELCVPHPLPNASAPSWKQRMYLRDRRSVRALTGSLGPPSSEALTKHLACPVWVNEKYRLAFVRIHKTGTSTILGHFTECGSAGANPDTCMQALPPCTPGQPRRSLDDYFVFATVRNPYARLVSLYSYLTIGSRGPDGKKRSGCPRLPWQLFCSDPVYVARYCPSRPACCRGAHDQFQPELYYKFTRQQTRCLTGEGGGWAVDYLLRVERLSEDFQAMAELINRQRSRHSRGVSNGGGSIGSSLMGGRSMMGVGGGGSLGFVGSMKDRAAGGGGPGAPAAQLLPNWLAGELPVGNPSQRSNDSYLASFQGRFEQCMMHTQRAYADDFRLLRYPTELLN